MIEVNRNCCRLVVMTAMFALLRNYQRLVQMTISPSNDQQQDSVIYSQAAKGNNIDIDIPNFSFQHELPNVQLIGSQKAGTTAISHWLFANDNVCQPKLFDNEPEYHTKEVQFFNNDERFNQGIDFYSRRYEHCIKEKYSLALDATPNTLMYPERVYQTYSEAVKQKKITQKQFNDLKILLIVREPIAREMSLYIFKKNNYDRAVKRRQQLNQTRTEKEWFDDVENEDGSAMTFDQYVESKTMVELDEHTSLSLYAYHLSKWFKYFNRSQILVMTYDELKNNPSKVQWRLRLFLSLDDYTSTKGGTLEEHNTGVYTQTTLPSCNVQDKLKAMFQKHNDDLLHLLNDFHPNNDPNTNDISTQSKYEYTPGPPMEQKPFPQFQLSNCNDTATGSIRNNNNLDGAMMVPSMLTTTSTTKATTISTTNTKGTKTNRKKKIKPKITFY